MWSGLTKNSGSYFQAAGNKAILHSHSQTFPVAPQQRLGQYEYLPSLKSGNPMWILPIRPIQNALSAWIIDHWGLCNWCWLTISDNKIV